MKRGEVLLVRFPNSPAAKARPCIVVQRESVLEASDKVTICPLTTFLRGREAQRPLLHPSPENGLLEPSEVEVDWILTVTTDRIGASIGHVRDMRDIEAAMRRWLDL